MIKLYSILTMLADLAHEMSIRFYSQGKSSL